MVRRTLFSLMLLGWSFPAECQSVTSFSSSEVFEEVWETVREHFYDPNYNGVDWDAAKVRYEPLARGASSIDGLSPIINRMLSELETSHTRFYTRSDTAYYQLLDLFSTGPLGEEIEKLFPSGEARYTGIGVFTRRIGDGVFVYGVLEGEAAHEAGLVVGDRILSVDGGAFHPVHAFHGKNGQEVHLSVQRSADPSSVVEIKVVPRSIRPNETFLEAMRRSVRVIEHQGVSLGYVHVWSYAGEVYHELLREEVAFGRLKGADGLILDLRDGWGGANPSYLNLFNPKVPVLSMRERSGEWRSMDSQWRRPVVLIINGGTRSGKEALTYGFRKHALGKVVGTRTAGAVTAGRPFLLKDGSLLFLAVADARVDGERLEGRGVAPDIEVAYSIEYAGGKDPQLEKAIDVLRAQIENDE
jgi:carboxyl-terminal processing protease